MRVVALAGGTGSAKLLRGLSKLPIDLTVVGNVGDNVWMYGTYVCPDVDIACYTLAGIASSRGWGIEGDTFNTMSSLSRLGFETWFRLGDKDMATCLARTEMIRKGSTLTEATDMIRARLGVKHTVLPVTDDHLETKIETGNGRIHLQEFWVRDKGRPRVKKIIYEGSGSAKASEEVVLALNEAEKVVVCPANPITSIGPMLAAGGISQSLVHTSAKVIALSPMTGKAPFSGPALKLMKASMIRGDSVGVAELYSNFLDAIMISSNDAVMKVEVESLGIECGLSDIRMGNAADEIRLAKEILAI